MKEVVWVAANFSNAYVAGTGPGKRTNTGDPIVRGLTCAKGASGNPGNGSSDPYYGTHLASAMKGRRASCSTRPRATSRGCRRGPGRFAR